MLIENKLRDASPRDPALIIDLARPEMPLPPDTSWPLQTPASVAEGEKLSEEQQHSQAVVAFPTSFLIKASLIMLFLVWAFWPTIQFLGQKWFNDPQYSHGLLVPFVSLLLFRRKFLEYRGDIFSSAWPVLGLGLITIIIGIRALAGGLLFFQLDALAFILTLLALSMLYGGKRFLVTALPALFFLGFMIPLPYELEQNLGAPLKKVATVASTFLLQTLGYSALSEGNIILIDEVRLGVVDACSGLKMLMTFSAFAFGAVLILDRTRFEKLLIILGIVPIALIVNVLRITATGVAYTMTNDKAQLQAIHDFNGWLMMPGGLLLLMAQLALLNRLIIREQNEMPVNIFATSVNTQSLQNNTLPVIRDTEWPTTRDQRKDP